MAKVRKTKTVNHSTNLKAKAVKKTRVSKRKVSTFLNPSSYTKSVWDNIENLSQDFLSNRIEDQKKVESFVVPMAKASIKVAENHFKKINNPHTFSTLVNLIYKVSKYDKKSKVSSFEGEVANIVRRSLLVAYFGFTMNSKAEVFKGKTKIAIRDLHKTLKAEASKSEDKNLQELAGKSRNRTVAQNETENKKSVFNEKDKEQLLETLKRTDVIDFFMTDEKAMLELKKAISDMDSQIEEIGETYIPKKKSSTLLRHQA
jgi:hypothetical protein